MSSCTVTLRLFPTAAMGPRRRAALCPRSSRPRLLHRLRGASRKSPAPARIVAGFVEHLHLCIIGSRTAAGRYNWILPAVTVF